MPTGFVHLDAIYPCWETITAIWHAGLTLVNLTTKTVKTPCLRNVSTLVVQKQRKHLVKVSETFRNATGRWTAENALLAAPLQSFAADYVGQSATMRGVISIIWAVVATLKLIDPLVNGMMGSVT